MKNRSHHSLEPILEKVGRSLSERFSIRVVCQGDRCCTNGRTIFLPSLPEDIPKDLYEAIRGYTDHESAHIAFRSDFTVAKEFQNQYDAEAFMLLNSFEDMRVEEAMRRKYPGSGHNLERAYAYATAEAQASGTPIAPMRQLAFAVYTMANGHPVPGFVSRDIQDVAGRIRDLAASAVYARNTKEIAALAGQAWEIVKNIMQSQRKPSSASPQQATGDGYSGGKNVAPVGNADPRQAPNPWSSSQQQGAQPIRDPATASQEITTQDGTTQPGAASSDAQGDPVEETTGAGILGDLAKTIPEKVNTYAETAQPYRVWSTARDKTDVSIYKPLTTHAERMANILSHVAGVRQRLLQSLQAQPRARWLGGQERGRIDPRSLYRLACPVQGREANPCVFRTRVKTRRIHTAAALLVDESNSMRGNRIRMAANTAAVFCEALSRLNIPTSVIGFSTGQKDFIREAMKTTGMTQEELQRRYRLIPLQHTVYKTFGEKFSSVSGRLDGMFPKSLTPLGESMLHAARLLAERREERKVLFVLTDGKPVVGIDPEDVTFQHARDSIKRIEKAGIEVMLVGIMELSVHSLHHRAVVVNTLDDLSRTVMRQLRTLLAP